MLTTSALILAAGVMIQTPMISQAEDNTSDRDTAGEQQATSNQTQTQPETITEAESSYLNLKKEEAEAEAKKQQTTEERKKAEAESKAAAEALEKAEESLEEAKNNLETAQEIMCSRSCMSTAVSIQDLPLQRQMWKRKAKNSRILNRRAGRQVQSLRPRQRLR